MGKGGGGNSVTTSNAEPGLTEEERALINKEIEIQDFRFEQLQKQSAFQDQLRKSLPVNIEGEREFIRQEREASRRGRELQKIRGQLEHEQLEQAQQLLPLQLKIAERELEAFERGGRASPEEIAHIEALAQEQEGIGLSQLDKSTEAIIDQITGETGTSLELSRTQAESERQQRQFGRDIGAFTSQAKLNFPINRATETGTTSRQLAGLGSLAGQFQSELQQRANANRMQLVGQTGSLGLGLATSIGANPGQVGVGLQKARIEAAGTTTVTEGGGPSGASVAGAGLGVLGAILAPFTAGASLALTAVGAGLSAAGR